MNLFLSKIRNRWFRLCTARKSLHPLAGANLVSLDYLDRSLKARCYRYVIVDLETTGLDFGKDRIVSVGAVRVENGNILLGHTFDELVNPGREISPSSIRIHGITPDMVTHARSEEEVFNDFLDFLGNDIVVAHHAQFDLHFLNRVMKKSHGFPLQNLVLDTVLMCKSIVFPPHPYPYGIDLNSRQFSLDAVAKHFHIEIHGRHTALGDAMATAMIFQRIISMLESQGPGRLRDLVKVSGIAF